MVIVMVRGVGGTWTKRNSVQSGDLGGWVSVLLLRQGASVEVRLRGQPGRHPSFYSVEGTGRYLLHHRGPRSSAPPGDYYHTHVTSTGVLFFF